MNWAKYIYLAHSVMVAIENEKRRLAKAGAVANIAE